MGEIFPALTALFNWRSWRLPFLADETAFWVHHIQQPYLTPRFRLFLDRTPEIWDARGSSR